MRLQGTQGASVAPYLGSPVVLSCRRAKVVGGGGGPMCRVASSLSVKCVACAPKLSSADVPVSPKNPREQSTDQLSIWACWVLVPNPKTSEITAQTHVLRTCPRYRARFGLFLQAIFLRLLDSWTPRCVDTSDRPLVFQAAKNRPSCLPAFGVKVCPREPRRKSLAPTSSLLPGCVRRRTTSR